MREVSTGKDTLSIRIVSQLPRLACILKYNITFQPVDQGSGVKTDKIPNLFMTDLEAIVDIIEELGIIENDKLITSACLL